MSLELLLGPQLEAFVAAGYDVVAASAPGPFVDAIEARGVRFHPLEHSTRAMALGSDVRATREVYDLFRSLRPTIVHTHNPKPGIYGRIAARAARVPVVVNTVHGLYAQPTDPLRRRSAVYALERLAATASHAELVQNPEDLALLARLGVPRGRLHLLGNGVDLDRFRPPGPDSRRAALRVELGVGDDDVVIGAVGRLVAEKGYPELFEAAARLRNLHPRMVLVVIGPHEPDKGDALDAAAVAAATAVGVRFLGHRSDVEHWYHAMDVYVLASHREGFPRSAMEAAASGLPVVATNIRGCRQVVDHGVTGLLVPPREPEALADVLAAIVDDAGRRRRLAEGALAKARTDFDQRTQIELTLATYERLLTRRGITPPSP